MSLILLTIPEKKKQIITEVNQLTQKKRNKSFMAADNFFGTTMVRVDKKRQRPHNKVPAKFRHKKKTNASDKDQSP